MKKLIPILLSALMFTGCAGASNSQTNTYRSITMDEAVAMMEQENGYIILDVRRPDEFAAGNIPGSVNIDVLTGHFGETAATMLDKAYTVAVYCRSGNRSKNAAKTLSMMGYNVVELDGGYNDWVEYCGDAK